MTVVGVSVVADVCGHLDCVYSLEAVNDSLSAC